MDTLFAEAAYRLFEQALPPEAAWQAIEDSGFLDALVPEAAGGAGMRLAEVLSLAQALGWHAVDAPVMQTLFARVWLHAVGQTPPRGPIALAPWAGYTDTHGVWACAVPAARAAHWVLTVLPDGVRLLSVETSDVAPPGGFGSLDADLVWAQSDDTIVRIEGAGVFNVSLLDLAAVSYTGLMAGALERVLTLTIDYAGQRSQFGRPIGRFQAIQQQLSVLTEAVWSVRSAAQLAFQSPDWMPRPLLAAQGKAYASAAASQAADIAHAVHGAIGITTEHALQRYTRRLRLWRRAAGGETYWAARVGAHALAAHNLNALDYLRTHLGVATGSGDQHV